MANFFDWIPPLLLLTPLAIMLAARFLSQTTVSWKHSVGFSLLLLALHVGFRLLAGQRLSVPAPAALALAFLPVFVGGAWFFRNRARTVDGQPGGWVNGLCIAGGTLLAQVVVLQPLLKSIERLV